MQNAADTSHMLSRQSFEWAYYACNDPFSSATTWVITMMCLDYMYSRIQVLKATSDYSSSLASSSSLTGSGFWGNSFDSTSACRQLPMSFDCKHSYMQDNCSPIAMCCANLTARVLVYKVLWQCCYAPVHNVKTQS